MVVCFRFSGNKHVKLKNLCPGRSCKMLMLAAWTFITYIFYFPMGPNNGNITFFLVKVQYCNITFFTPLSLKKVILQFSAPLGMFWRLVPSCLFWFITVLLIGFGKIFGFWRNTFGTIFVGPTYCKCFRKHLDLLHAALLENRVPQNLVL